MQILFDRIHSLSADYSVMLGLYSIMSYIYIHYVVYCKIHPEFERTSKNKGGSVTIVTTVSTILLCWAVILGCSYSDWA